MIKRKTLYFFRGLTLKKTLSLTIIYFFLTISMFSQQNDLVLKAEELIYSNPDEAIKIANHILNTDQEPEESAIVNLLLTKSYLVKGDYNNAIIYAFNDTNKLDEVTVKTQIENYILRATLSRKLFLDNQSKEYLNKASVLSSGLSSEKDMFEYHIFLEHINMLLDRLNTDEAVTAIESAKIRFSSFLKDHAEEKRAYYLAKERVFNSLSKYDSAFVYIDKTRASLSTSKKNNLYEKTVIYKELGHLYLQKKEFEKSEEAFFIAIRFAEILDNPFLLGQINKGLAINYLATNQKNKHKIYNDEFLALNTKAEQIEQESVNTFYNTISNQEKKQLKNEEQKYTTHLYLLIGAALFIIIIGILIILKSENRKKRKREIIYYLEASRNSFIKVKPTIKNAQKSIILPEETEQAILQKLKRFEKSQKFLKKDMSLAFLAGQFETNTNYLSVVINKNYNDNFNTFINKLRINYIIEKLKNDSNYMNYKISFLAEECGFSSHSNFATVFKSIIGISPATFINLLNTEKEEIKKHKETK